MDEQDGVFDMNVGEEEEVPNFEGAEDAHNLNPEEEEEDAPNLDPEEEEEDGPVDTYHIHQFVDTLSSLLDDPAKEDDFISFALTGVCSRRPNQASIDLLPNALQDTERIIRSNDFDSVIGLDRDIKFFKDFQVCCVPKIEDTLTVNVHINVNVDTSYGRDTVQLHRIPNLCLGTVGLRTMVRFFIPKLYTQERKTSQLTQEELAKFYDRGLRPAIKNLIGVNAREWPDNYNSEMWRARSRAGTLSFRTAVLSPKQAADLSDELRLALEQGGLPWGTGAFVMHQIRGVKGAHSYEWDKGAEALDNLLETVGMSMVDTISGDWWVDCGLQIALESNRCLSWRSDAHWRLAQAALKLSDDAAKKLTTPGSSKYIRDSCSGLTQASGFRASPGITTRGPDGVLYIQAYTTDKTITARREGWHYAKFMHGEDFLKDRAIPYLVDLYNIYKRAINENASIARIEIRIPIEYADTALEYLTDDVLYQSLFSIPTPAYWCLRAYRSHACRLILQRQLDAPMHLRISEPALILSAICIWLANALHATPDMGKSCRELIDIAVPHIERVGADRNILAHRTPLYEEDMDVDASDGEQGLTLSDVDDGNDEPVPQHETHAPRPPIPMA